jgi:hypothetical protein
VLAARILAEARASFAEHGYAGTTVRAVARAAGVDPALVYHYGSKESLLDAATTAPPSPRHPALPRRRRPLTAQRTASWPRVASMLAAMTPANAPDRGKDRDRDTDPAPPEQSAEDTDAGWGQAPEAGDDERFYRDRPPHWGSD